MTDIVTGTPAVVGFTSGHNGHRDHGWSDKDQSFASAIDAGERTRDVLHAIHEANERAVSASVANGVAIEKVGAATSLAVEKVGAAGILEGAKNTAALGLNIEKTAAATNLAIAVSQAATNLAIEKTAAAQLLATEKVASAAQLVAAQNHAAAAAQLAECCCEMRALVHSQEAQRTRDALQLLQTQVAVANSGKGAN